MGISRAAHSVNMPALANKLGTLRRSVTVALAVSDTVNPSLEPKPRDRVALTTVWVVNAPSGRVAALGGLEG